MGTTVNVNFVGDISCPWCYIGLHELIRAQKFLKDELNVEARWIPFEIFPHLPNQGADRNFHMSAIFGSRQRAESVFKQVEKSGANAGLQLRFDLVQRSINTFNLNRIIWKFGHDADALSLAMRFFEAYFSLGMDLQKLDCITRIMSDFGWPPTYTRDFLQSPEGTDALMAFRAEQLAKGIDAVPVIEISGTQKFAGAASFSNLLQAFRKKSKI